MEGRCKGCNRIGLALLSGGRCCHCIEVSEGRGRPKKPWVVTHTKGYLRAMELLKPDPIGGAVAAH
ncbi:hypothetical protein GR11A_00172 [Vibrio phage vB_VcorM_GR11A]|nr:hypothetical protein GR11A_00172 [Vibrio phage vB_VcorM_GR11A]